MSCVIVTSSAISVLRTTKDSIVQHTRPENAAGPNYHQLMSVQAWSRKPLWAAALIVCSFLSQTALASAENSAVGLGMEVSAAGAGAFMENSSCSCCVVVDVQ